ncbi:hypothetical protein [Lactobacillus paragasseri]|uniref:hypothetical protein n=1 Tax=Lactobacillus paragasseri TaxID=2107999 RepID=UPI003B952684
MAKQLQDSFLEDSFYPKQIKKIEAIMFPPSSRKSLGVQVDSYGIFLVIRLMTLEMMKKE